MPPFPSASRRPTPPPAAQAIVFWILWFSMTSGVCIIHYFLGPASRAKAASDATDAALGPIEVVCIGAVVAAMIVRFLVLPRFDSLQKKLPVFIVAMAMAEGCGVIGTIVARSHQRELFTLSLVALALLAPVFALPRAESFPRSDR